MVLLLVCAVCADHALTNLNPVGRIAPAICASIVSGDSLWQAGSSGSKGKFRCAQEILNHELDDRGGVSRFDGATWTNYTTKNSGLSGESVSSIASDSRGNFWFGSWDGGASKFDGATWANYGGDHSVYAVAIDPQDNAWLGTDSGVMKFDGTMTAYTTANSGLVDDLVTAVVIDPDGGRWFGTTGAYGRGVSKLQIAHDPLLFFDDFTDGSPAGAPRWTEIAPNWSVTAEKRYRSDGRGERLAIVTDLAPARQPVSTGRISARVNLKRTITGVPNASVVFGYADKNRQRWVRCEPGYVTIGQTGNYASEMAGVKVREAVPGLKLNTWANVSVEVGETGRVDVIVNDKRVATYTFQAIATGGVGVAATRSKTLFDDFGVWDATVLAP